MSSCKSENTCNQADQVGMVSLQTTSTGQLQIQENSQSIKEEVSTHVQPAMCNRRYVSKDSRGRTRRSDVGSYDRSISRERSPRCCRLPPPPPGCTSRISMILRKSTAYDIDEIKCLRDWCNDLLKDRARRVVRKPGIAEDVFRVYQECGEDGTKCAEKLGMQPGWKAKATHRMSNRFDMFFWPPGEKDYIRSLKEVVDVTPVEYLPDLFHELRH